MLANSENKKTDLRYWITVAFSIILAVFHLYTAGFGIFPGYIQMGVHWGLIGSVIILARPSRFKGGWLFDSLCVVAVMLVAFYQIPLQLRLILRPAIYTQLDLIIAVLAAVSAIYLGFRLLGPVLPTICIAFILYGLYGNRIPGIFNTSVYSFKRIFTGLYVMGDGLFGSTLMVSAQFLMLYIFFGNFMEITGAGQFFVDMANSVAGRVRGGPAQAAVYSSMLMGMVSGSGAANVATTGTFTIPLMKKTGYQAKTAGAVEAVASSGGQIMPPVMGASAFLMSETLGIPYSTIAVCGFLPAVLYFTSLSATVYGYARKSHMQKVPKEQLPRLLHVIRTSWYHMVPLAVIIYLIFTGWSAQRSVFYAILTSFLMTLLFNRDKISLEKLLTACRKSAVSCGPMALSCMLAGIIMCMINMTGLGLKITTILQTIAGGSLLVTMILAMLTSLLLGMGLPTTAAYIVLAVLIAPTLVSFGVTPIAAHLFILYYGALSSITPPVALSAMTAAGISGAGLWETGFESIKLAATGFIVPFIFVFNNQLLLIGQPGETVFAAVTAFLGSAVLGLALAGWCGWDLPIWARVLLLPGSVMLVMAHPYWISLVGLVYAALIVLLVHVLARKKASSVN